MRSIIEELYYGNISPTDRDIIRGGRYSHILNLVTRNEEADADADTGAAGDV